MQIYVWKIQHEKFDEELLAVIAESSSEAMGKAIRLLIQQGKDNSILKGDPEPMDLLHVRLMGAVISK